MSELWVERIFSCREVKKRKIDGENLVQLEMAPRTETDTHPAVERVYEKAGRLAVEKIFYTVP